MSRTAEVFGRGRKVLIGYLMASDPDFEGSLASVRAAVRGGVDIIELGLPFSDPLADGPVIQAAAVRALESGFKTDHIFRLAREIRAEADIPLLVMTYFNPVLSYGAESFVDACRRSGFDGLLVPDLPFEESGEFHRLCRRAGLDLIPFVAPTTRADRLPGILEGRSGFVYAVSLTGVTGTKDPLEERVRKMVTEIRQNTDLPVAVGFGISRPTQAAAIVSASDAVIVGSRLVRESADPAAVEDTVSGFRAALDTL